MAEHNILENFNIGVLDNLCYLHIAKDSHVKINFADLPKLSDDSRVCVSACRALHSIYRHYKEDFLTDGSNVTAFGLLIKSLLPTLNPPRALGLILLLDQAPRQLLRGAEIYYAFAFFDHLALQVVTYIHSLPPHLRPDSKEHWMDKLNYPFNNWVYIRFLFILPSSTPNLLNIQLWQKPSVQNFVLRLKIILDWKIHIWREALQRLMARPLVIFHWKAQPRILMAM
ncbi:hypothetical protein H4I95_11509 [Botrytis cinerea]